ncbi:hypothetical protein [Streptomyces virginiae]|uniref:hypothetical protein n=1 Tax=Streptomyces virginiae TaxID=1961 RepID=UPI003331344D
MTARILTLDAYLDAPNVTHGAFRDPATIFEYDVVFWDPANTLRTYQYALGNSYFKGEPRISDHETLSILSDVTRRNREFVDFLAMGRTLAIFVSPEQGFYFDTGKREKSGTGRNQKVTTIVDRLDLLKAIPGGFKVVPAQGRRIGARSSAFSALVSGAPDRWWYRAILEDFPGDPLAVVAGTSKCVGSIQRNENGGILLLLPDLQGPDYVDDESEVGDSGGEELSASLDGLVDELGDAQGDDLGEDQASRELVAWVESLRLDVGEPAPPWLQRYKFSEDVEAAAEMARLEEERERVVGAIEDLKGVVEVSDRWKRLLYASGDDLESQVMEAFRLLGFEAESGPEDRADILLRLNGRVAVVEVKGLNGSAAEKNAAQLEKWISEEMLSGAGKPKGILVVNAYRQIPPEGRKKPTFPHQMVTFCTPREHCLVSTSQLLSMARKVMDDPSLAPSIAESLMGATGVLAGWDDVSSAFVSA